MKKAKLATSLREMPPEERPRERLSRLGPEALRDAELLAVLFRTGTRERSAVVLAEDLLRHFGDLRALVRASVEELQAVKGLGLAKAVEIRAALELGKRLASFAERDRVRVRTAEDVIPLLMPRMKDLEHEEFKAVLLNTKNEVLKIVEVSSGGLDSAQALPRDVFRQAVRECASAVLVCHNHPSGDPEPSASDLEITQRLKDGASLLGLRLLDHLIIGDNRYLSLRERNLL